MVEAPSCCHPPRVSRRTAPGTASPEYRNAGTQEKGSVVPLAALARLTLARAGDTDEALEGTAT
jgi:hypothetical protein